MFLLFPLGLLVGIAGLVGVWVVILFVILLLSFV